MQKILRNPDVLWREESFADTGDTPAEEAVAAILFADGQMLSLNELGTEIWKLCDRKTVDEIVAAVLAEFEVTESVVRQDVAMFLDELARKGFIRYE
jgi:GeoRSP system PqqD family protein